MGPLHPLQLPKSRTSSQRVLRDAPQGGLVKGVVIHSTLQGHGEHHQGRPALGDELVVPARKAWHARAVQAYVTSVHRKLLRCGAKKKQRPALGTTGRCMAHAACT